MHGSPNNQSKVTYKYFTNARFPQKPIKGNLQVLY